MIEKLGKLKVKLAIIGAVSSILIVLILLIAISTSLLMPFKAAQKAVDGFVTDVSNAFNNTIEKLTGFLGWNSKERAYYATIKNERDKLKGFSGVVGELDLSLLIATTNYDQMSDLEGYADSNDVTENDIFLEEDTDINRDNTDVGKVVKKKDTKKLVEINRKDLGLFSTLNNKNRKLIGNMVSRSYSASCIEGTINKTTPNLLRSMLPSMVKHLNEEQLNNLGELLDRLYEYDQMGALNKHDFIAKIKDNNFSSFEEIVELLDLQNVSFDGICEDVKDEDGKIIKMKRTYNVNYFVDIEKYKKYLFDFYVAEKYLHCKNCAYKELTKESDPDGYKIKVNTIIQDIFDLKDHYVIDEKSMNAYGLGFGNPFDYAFLAGIGNYPPPDPNIIAPYNGGVPGHCVWYVYNRMYQLGRPITIRMGNGGDWGANAANAGILVDKNAVPGIPVSFPGHAGNRYGHVAFVEEVYEDGSILISEMNYGWQLYKLNIRKLSPQKAATGNYIHWP